MITTRGDVELAPVIDSLPGWPVVVFDNSKREQDMKVYGYFAALEEVQTDYVYCQADDAIIPATQLLEAWVEDDADRILLNVRDGDTPWISFGGIFHRTLPDQAFSRYFDAYGFDDDCLLWCEVIFTELTPWRNVDLGKIDLPWQRNRNRMEHQPSHYTEQARVREKVRALL